MKALLLGLPGALIASMFAFIILLVPPACGAAGISVNAAALPPAVGQYTGDQLQNAAAILNAGANLGVTVEAQTIAIMTAIGESSLHNIDTGDTAGPDSRGLFQQRDNGAWGTLADRMNPTIAAQNFYRALLAVDGWETLAPTLAANRVQGNADPYHYEPFLGDAKTIIAELGASQSSCQAGPAGEVNAQGWSKPVDGTVTDHYGPREVVCVNGLCSSGFHQGVDIGTPAETPIYAVRGGTVTAAGPNGSYGNWIIIDHGEGFSTVYAHMYGDDIFVTAGQTVQAGQNIARVGCSGICTGAHLHFEVRINNDKINPELFLQKVGISWD